MRRLIALLIALAFIGVSLTSPALATPVDAAMHQTHCADMPATPTDHQKAPAKQMDGQKCCFSALPAVSVNAAETTVYYVPIAHGRIAYGNEAALTGMNWTADPPPPRLD